MLAKESENILNIKKIWYFTVPDNFFKMVIQERLELPAHSLEGCCSIQLSYWTISVLYDSIFQYENQALFLEMFI